MEEDIILELQDISMSFNSQSIFSGLSLRSFRDEEIIISAPSGTGKTTLADIIAGLILPNAGKRNVNTNKIGYAFQDDRLIPWKTALDNLSFVANCRGGSKNKQRDVIHELLDCFEIYPNSMPTELSGGAKRRLNIARALIINPDLLILDEPFAFQDMVFESKITNMIKNLSKTKQICLVVLKQEHQEFPQCLPTRKAYKIADLTINLFAHSSL